MTRIPAHRRKKDPWRNIQLGVYKPPPIDMPDCRCQHRWQGHAPKGMTERAECLHTRCNCRGYRQVEDR